MNDQQRIKFLQLQVALDDHLRDVVTQKGARQFLLDEIANSPAGKSHIFGTGPAPSPRELADQVWATDRGSQLRDILAQKEQADADHHESDRDRKLAEIQAIENPRERINAARRAGLA